MMKKMTLSKQQIDEGNAKLAKLLGWFQDNHTDSYLYYEKNEIAVRVAYDIRGSAYRDLPFHRDWNYLMKVVDRIGYLVYHREGDEPDYNWKDHYSYMELFRNIFQKWLNAYDNGGIEFNLMNSIDRIWVACVAYVDWYNNKEVEDFD